MLVFLRVLEDSGHIISPYYISETIFYNQSTRYSRFVQVFIQSVEGAFISMIIPDSAYGLDLSTIVQSHTGIPPSLQVLRLRGKKVQLSTSLSSQGIENGCTLELSIALHGGGGV